MLFKFFTVLIIIHKARILSTRSDILTSRNAKDFMKKFFWVNVAY